MPPEFFFRAKWLSFFVVGSDFAGHGGHGANALQPCLWATANARCGHCKRKPQQLSTRGLGDLLVIYWFACDSLSICLLFIDVLLRSPSNQTWWRHHAGEMQSRHDCIDCIDMHIDMQRSYGFSVRTSFFFCGELRLIDIDRRQTASGCGVDTLRRLLGVSRCVGRFDHQQCSEAKISGNFTTWILTDNYLNLCLRCNTCYWYLLITCCKPATDVVTPNDLPCYLSDAKMDVHFFMNLQGS